jgi:hypothetical protein
MNVSGRALPFRGRLFSFAFHELLLPGRAGPFSPVCGYSDAKRICRERCKSARRAGFPTLDGLRGTNKSGPLLGKIGKGLESIRVEVLLSMLVRVTKSSITDSHTHTEIFRDFDSTHPNESNVQLGIAV